MSKINNKETKNKIVNPESNNWRSPINFDTIKENIMRKYKRVREKWTRDKRFKVVRQCAYIHTQSPLGYILHL